MTSKTDNRSNREVELPEPLEQLDHEIEQEEDRLARLQELGDQIEPVYEEAEQLDQEGREIVAEEIPKVRHDLGGSRTIDELEKIADRIVDIVADPYRQAVRQARDDVLDTLELDGEFDNGTIQELNELLEDRSSDQLRDNRDVFDSAELSLDQLAKEAIDVIAGRVREEPVRILGSPGEAFQPLVNRHAEQHDALQELDDELGDVEWSPDVTLVETKSLYPGDGTKVDVETITEYVGNIRDVVKTMPDALPLATVIRARLEAVLPEAAPGTLDQTFEAISVRVSDSANHKTEFKLSIRLVDCLEGQADQIGDVDHHLEKLRAPLDDDGLLGRGDPVDGLVARLKELSHQYGRWAERHRQILQRDAVAIEAIQSHIDGLPEFKPNEGSLTVTDDPIDVDTVYENPLKAVRFHGTYREWVKALKTDGSGDDSLGGRADVDLLIDLVRGERVASGKVDPDDFEVLAELLENGLKLQYAGADSLEEQ